jgi:hypothetical protein
MIIKHMWSFVKTIALRTTLLVVVISRRMSEVSSTSRQSLGYSPFWSQMKRRRMQSSVTVCDPILHRFVAAISKVARCEDKPHSSHYQQ